MPLELCWPGGEKVERLGKKDLARHIATYAAAKLEETNIVGRWLATISYPMARVTLGRHVWDLSPPVQTAVRPASGITGQPAEQLYDAALPRSPRPRQCCPDL